MALSIITTHILTHTHTFTLTHRERERERERERDRRELEQWLQYSMASIANYNG